MYNRASADANGKPWDPTRAGIKWNGEKWVGDVPDMKPDAPPGQFGAFIMLPEGVARLFVAGAQRRPVPRALRGGGGPGGERAPPQGHARARWPKRLPATRTSWARRTSTRSSAPPTASPSTSTTGPSTRSMDALNEVQPGSSSRSRRTWRRRRASQNGEMGARHLRPRLDRGPGDGDHPDPSFMQDRTGRRSGRSASPSTGASPVTPQHEGPAGQHPDLVGHRPEHLDAGVQGLPGEAGEGGEGLTMPIPGLEIIQSSASLRGTGSGFAEAAQGGQAHRHHDLHRLQGVRGGLPGVERPAETRPPVRTAATRRCPASTPTSGT